MMIILTGFLFQTLQIAKEAQRAAAGQNERLHTELSINQARMPAACAG